jgi:4-nitrophenyl phosphatase
MGRIRGVVLDVDGTLRRGSEPIPGAAEAVRTLRERGLSVAVVTNNPTATPAGYAAELGQAGIDVDPASVVTAGSVTAEQLAETSPDAPTYVVGEDPLREQLQARGIPLTDDPDAARVVVGSIDREFDYRGLSAAMGALSGAPPSRFVSTDPDRVIPTDDGLVPGSGAIVDAMASVAGRRPDATMGKPHRPAREAAFAAVGVPPADCLVVGDRPDTDVATGVRAGAATALVRSGVSDGEDPDPAPDAVVDSVADVPELLADPGGLGDR